jgi:hypothetical protein
MTFLKYVFSAVIALALVACGGGGGSAGTVAGGSSPTTTNLATITLSIVDSNDAPPTSNSISSGSSFFAKAIVKDASNAVVPNKLVTFSTTPTVATLTQPSALTDTNGVAKVQITPVSLTTVTAGNVTASTTVGTVAVTSSLDYQTTAANVTLNDLKATPNAISALQSAAVTVEARVNGVLAGSSTVVANFSASCGSFSPASVPTNSAGIASSTYQSLVTCSGPVTITAQAAGAPIVTTSVAVTAAQPANIVFDSATVPLMVSTAATGGLKQSSLKFKVVDSSGAGMSGQGVNIALSNATISAGVAFSIGGVPTVAPQTVTTDGAGIAAVTVTSGSLPTPVIVTATLAGNTSVQASSSGVSVTSGRATQNAASLSATKLSIEAFRTDGVQTELSMRVADRQGNPVPVGAVVNFVASHGLVQGSCTIDTASQCSVTYTSQGAVRGFGGRGRVTILAYMDGEESFVDLNGDNIWQLGESFFDVGTLYRDDNESLSYDAATEQTYPGGSTGTSVCPANIPATPPATKPIPPLSYPSVENTCDGTWSGNIRVRQQIVVALATSGAVITATSTRSKSGFSVFVADENGNAMPTGTTVTASVATSEAVCKVVGAVSPNVVRNSSNGGGHSIFLDEAADCLTVKVNVTVTTPAGVGTIAPF